MDEHHPLPQTPKSSHTSSLAMLLVLILALMAAALAYLVYLQKNSSGSGSSSEFQTLQKQVNQQAEGLRVQQEELNQLKKKLADSTENPAISQIEYLVNLANLNLMAGRDAESAGALLKLAMETVALQNDSALANLQKSLESDVARVNALAAFKVEDLVVELGTINERLQALSIMPNLEFKPPVDSKNKEKLPWTQRLLQSFSGLKDLFIIRHVAANAPPLITPPEEVFLKENIQNKLMLAQWAVIHQKPLIYQNSLKEVLNWVKKYFHNPQSIQPIVEALTKLQTLNVKRDFPGLDNTLKILAQLQQKGLPAKAPQTPAKVLPKPQEPPKASGVEI